MLALLDYVQQFFHHYLMLLERLLLTRNKFRICILDTVHSNGYTIYSTQWKG